jgi:hypothetical protein
LYAELSGSKFVDWAVQEGLTLTPSVFSIFINKKMREDRCQVIVPILNKYLEMAKENKISVTPLKKGEPTQRAQSKSSDLSKENEEFIEHFRRVITKYGMYHFELHISC